MDSGRISWLTSLSRFSANRVTDPSFDTGNPDRGFVMRRGMTLARLLSILLL